MMDDFHEPQIPDVVPILELHRGHDGFITFGRKDGDEWHGVGSMPAAELESMFPAFRQQLVQDSYFSINAFWRPGTRKTTDARWLTAAYTDLDAYEPGTVAANDTAIAQMIAGIVYLEELGKVPPASMLMRSGRGVWAFWFLHDEDDPGKPVRAWPEKVALYAQIQQQIHERCAEAELGADAKSRDVSRVTRVPGSWHSVAKRRVAYRLNFDAGGKPFTYSLPELASHLDVIGRAYHAVERRALGMDEPRTLDAPGKNPNKRRGWIALYERRLKAFSVLRNRRGGFPEGTRHHALLIYAHILKRHGVPMADLTRHVTTLGEECIPKLEAADIRDAISSGIKLRAFRDQTISDWLKVTPEESELTGLPVQTADRQLVGVELLNPPVVARERRRNALKRIIREAKHVPPLVQLRAELASHGIDASTATIRSDLMALGITNPRSHGRARATQIKLPIPD